MADLTGLTNDELADGFGDHFAELESRVAANGTFPRVLRSIQAAHAHMASVHGTLSDAGHVSPDSAGGPKE